MIFEPSVKLIATTMLWTDEVIPTKDHYDSLAGMGLQDNVTGADSLAEFAGRSCYQSFNRPNPKTAKNEDYLANILRQGHESVLEHASASFYIEGVSRALTHELIRHRHLSYSQLSQRFVDESESEIVCPPALAKHCSSDGEMNELDESWFEASSWYKSIVQTLTEDGLPRKQAREAARAVLPNMTETKIVVTGNMRAWRDVIKRRYTLAADAEIRKVAGLILSELRQLAPNSFQDIPEEPQ